MDNLFTFDDILNENDSESFSNMFESCFAYEEEEEPETENTMEFTELDSYLTEEEEPDEDMNLSEYEESSKTTKTKKKSLVEKIKEFFKKLWEKFVNFITKNHFKTKLDDARKKLTTRGVGKKKVQITDYSKLTKLQKETLAALRKCKNGKQVDAIMERYNKNKTKLLATKAGIIAVSAAALIGSAAAIVNNSGKMFKSFQDDAVDVVSGFDVEPEDTFSKVDTSQKAIPGSKVLGIEDSTKYGNGWTMRNMTTAEREMANNIAASVAEVGKDFNNTMMSSVTDALKVTNLIGKDA